MRFNRWLRVFAPICLSLLLFTTGCSLAPPSPYAQAQKDSTGWNAPKAVAKTAEQGAKFNQFFPGTSGKYNVVAAQEKKGFAEYKVNQDGKTVAMLSISDTTSVPAAAAKYETSTDRIAGYPAVDQGTTATGILVNGRYQVKVLSRDTAFTRDDRVAWLQKFDLRGLSKLEGAKTAAQPKLPTTARPAPQLIPDLTPQPAT